MFNNVFQVEGGYYADVDLECQAFQICVHTRRRGLEKVSFLCPNGSLFDQQYFICDFWFNVDCSLANSLYYLNDLIAEERESNNGAEAGPVNEITSGFGRVGNLVQGRSISVQNKSFVGGKSFKNHNRFRNQVGGPRPARETAASGNTNNDFINYQNEKNSEVRDSDENLSTKDSLDFVIENGKITKDKAFTVFEHLHGDSNSFLNNKNKYTPQTGSISFDDSYTVNNIESPIIVKIPKEERKYHQHYTNNEEVIENTSKDKQIIHRTLVAGMNFGK